MAPTHILIIASVHFDSVHFVHCNAVFNCCTWRVSSWHPLLWPAWLQVALEVLHVCCWSKLICVSFNEEWKSGVEFSVNCWKSFRFSFMLENVFAVHVLVMLDSSVIFFSTSRFYFIVLSFWHFMQKLSLTLSCVAPLKAYAISLASHLQLYPNFFFLVFITNCIVVSRC